MPYPDYNFTLDLQKYLVAIGAMPAKMIGKYSSKPLVKVYALLNSTLRRRWFEAPHARLERRLKHAAFHAQAVHALLPTPLDRPPLIDPP